MANMNTNNAAKRRHAGETLTIRMNAATCSANGHEFNKASYHDRLVVGNAMRSKLGFFERPIPKAGK